METNCKTYTGGKITIKMDLEEIMKSCGLD